MRGEAGGGEGAWTGTAGVSGSRLRSELLAVARARAGEVRAADVVGQWRRDRFVRPSTADPRSVWRVETRLWELLPQDVHGVELSPVVPLGTCGAVAPVSQNRIVTTMRLTEVLSDATNALAVEAAVRRRDGWTGPLHLAACHRHLRAQDFGGAPAHFRLFALVSSMRDTGSARSQAALLTRHMTYWLTVLADLIPTAAPQLRWSTVGSGPPAAAVRERILDTVLPQLPQRSGASTPPQRPETPGGLEDGDGSGGGSGPFVAVVEDPQRERGIGYYQDAALRMTARSGDAALELGDGGLTTWTASLTGDAKERCLVSCIATERLTELATHMTPRSQQ